MYLDLKSFNSNLMHLSKWKHFLGWSFLKINIYAKWLTKRIYQCQPSVVSTFLSNFYLKLPQHHWKHHGHVGQKEIHAAIIYHCILCQLCTTAVSLLQQWAISWQHLRSQACITSRWKRQEIAQSIHSVARQSCLQALEQEKYLCLQKGRLVWHHMQIRWHVYSTVSLSVIMVMIN